MKSGIPKAKTNTINAEGSEIPVTIKIQYELDGKRVTSMNFTYDFSGQECSYQSKPDDYDVDSAKCQAAWAIYSQKQRNTSYVDEYWYTYLVTPSHAQFANCVEKITGVEAYL